MLRSTSESGGEVDTLHITGLIVFLTSDILKNQLSKKSRGISIQLNQLLVFAVICN